MNAENFSEYLKNPSQLYQISYQELKSLVLQYPYSPNLRYLLMRKAKMDNHADYDGMLGMASTYSIDRNFLFKKMKADRLIPHFEENYELNEEYLELKDLAVLEVEPDLVEKVGAKKTDELAFALDDLMDVPEITVVETPPVSKKVDNLAEEETGSLLERLLDGEFTDLEAAKEHEAMSNLSLADMAKADHSSPNEAVEERIIENSLEELSEKSDLIQQFEAGIQETKEVEIEVDGPADKTDVEKAKAQDIEPELAQQSVENETGVTDETDAGEQGLIIEQEHFPDLELKPLESMVTDETFVQVAFTLDDLVEENEPAEIVEEKLVVEIVDLIDFDAEFEEIESEVKIGEEEEEEDVPTLNELAKKPKEGKEIANLSSSFLPKPLPKSSFNSWLEQYRSPFLKSKMEEGKEESDKKGKKKKKKGKDKDTLGVAKASVREDFEIATETLASLLEKQGHYGRAIRMYETLRLRNPEKSAFFAAKIEASQKLRDEEQEKE
ncbi:MAG: hypothetical protein ACI9XO_002148 [Paraglaciecola sp.]|jgi:hypothetical protein